MIKELTISKEELLEKKFCTNKDFILRDIADEHVLIPLMENEIFDNTLISLNETAAFLWKVFSNGSSIKNAITIALDVYDSSYDIIEDSVINFILENLKFDLLREEN